MRAPRKSRRRGRLRRRVQQGRVRSRDDAIQRWRGRARASRIKAVAMVQHTTRGRFSQLLVSEGLVDEAQIAVAKAHCPDARIASALIVVGAIAPEVVNRALAQHHGLTPLKLSALDHDDPEARALVPAALARRLQAVAIAVMTTAAGRTLLVAMRDPGDLSAIDELTFATGMKIDARIVPEIYLVAALDRDRAPADSDGGVAP